MRRRRSLLRKGEDSDPMSVVSNLFDVARGLCRSTYGRARKQIQHDGNVFAGRFHNGEKSRKDNMEIITKEGEKINRYTPSEDSDPSSGKGKRSVLPMSSRTETSSTFRNDHIRSVGTNQVYQCRKSLFRRNILLDLALATVNTYPPLYLARLYP